MWGMDFINSIMWNDKGMVFNVLKTSQVKMMMFVLVNMIKLGVSPNYLCSYPQLRVKVRSKSWE